MSIILSTRPEVKAIRPVRPFAQGIDADPTLAIRGVAYRVQSFTGDEGETGLALTKVDGTTYHVVATASGIECDCPDYVWTRAERGEQCKHIRGVIAAGLIAEPTPAKTTTPAPVAKAVEQAPAPEASTATAPAVEETTTPAPREWSAIERKRAAAFGLKSPTGMKRPTAPRPAPVVEVKAPAVEPTPARTIEQTARSFQAADLALWAFGYAGARLDAASAAIRRDKTAMTTPTIDDAHRERIEALIPTRAERDETRRRVPVIPATPEPAPVEKQAPKPTTARTTPAQRGPTAEDFAFEFGRSLGLELEEPTPTPSHYSPEEARAFELGQARASDEIDAWFDVLAEENRERDEWDGLARSHGIRRDVEDAELAEARLSRPAIYCFA